jgi:hypothetical protein
MNFCLKADANVTFHYKERNYFLNFLFYLSIRDIRFLNEKYLPTYF